MEENISKMSKNLANFCNNLHSTSSSFRQSLERRPIPLDSASSTFIQTLNRRVASLTGDGVDDLEEDFMAQTSSGTSEPESQLDTSCFGSVTNNMDGDSLFEESPSFQKLGLSDISLATLASGGVRKHDVLDSPPKFHRLEVLDQDTSNIHSAISGEEKGEPNSCETSKLILVSSEDYESLPSYMKSVASWKDLQSAVEKMNSFLNKKEKKEECDFFHPEELESMGLGCKGRSYVLLLVRMKRLNVETKNGLISYKVL